MGDYKLGAPMTIDSGGAEITTASAITRSRPAPRGLIRTPLFSCVYRIAQLCAALSAFTMVSQIREVRGGA